MFFPSGLRSAEMYKIENSLESCKCRCGFSRLRSQLRSEGAPLSLCFTNISIAEEFHCNSKLHLTGQKKCRICQGYINYKR